MKHSQKKYDIKCRNKQRLKYERSLRASDRLESYSFQRANEKLSLSYELKGNLVLKRDFYLSLSSGSLWTDRTSRIGAPFGAEMFLENERAMPEVLMGCPRYYFHELDQSSLPNARSRFPYDRVAHTSAKIITRFLRMNLTRRHRAATIIKRNIKRYMKKRGSRMEAFIWNKCITMVQQLFRRHRNLFRYNAAILRQERADRREKERLAALEDQRRNFEGAKKIRLTIAYCHLTRRARDFIHRKRRERGIRRRQFIFACRLQAVYRGQKLRRELKKRRDAGIFLLYWFRKYWRRKHHRDGLKIQRAFRNYQLRKAVITIQKIYRRRLGVRKRDKAMLEMIAEERNRANRECLVMTDFLNKTSKDLKWMNDDEQVPFITTHDHMKRIDLYCLAVLLAHPLQSKEPYSQSIHPADFGEDDYVDETAKLISTSADSHERRIVIAILNIFVNRPGSCIDGAVFSIIKDSGLLKPSKSSGLSEAAWNSLEHIPLLNIHSLAKILEPTKSLLFRVNINGRGRYLPSIILQQTILVNRWTLHFEFLLKRKLKKFRKLYPPRRTCSYCLEPMIFDGQLYDHRRCCRNGFPSWMLSDMKETFDVLKKLCNNVQPIEYKRDLIKDQMNLNEGLKLSQAKDEEKAKEEMALLTAEPETAEPKKGSEKKEIKGEKDGKSIPQKPSSKEGNKGVDAQGSKKEKEENAPDKGKKEDKPKKSSKK